MLLEVQGTLSNSILTDTEVGKAPVCILNICWSHMYWWQGWFVAPEETAHE